MKDTVRQIKKIYTIFSPTRCSPSKSALLILSTLIGFICISVTLRETFEMTEEPDLLVPSEAISPISTSAPQCCKHHNNSFVAFLGQAEPDVTDEVAINSITGIFNIWASLYKFGDLERNDFTVLLFHHYPELEALFQCMGINVRHFKPFKFQQRKYTTRFKLWAWNLTEYDNICILDGDLLIRHSLQEIMDTPEFAAIVSDGWNKRRHFNSGIIKGEPTKKFRALMDEFVAKEKTRGEKFTDHKDWTDQHFFNILFRWLKKNNKGPKMTILDRKWNNARPYDILEQKEMCDETSCNTDPEALDEWFHVVHFGRGWGPFTNKPFSGNVPEIIKKLTSKKDPRYQVIAMWYKEWWDLVQLFWDKAKERECVSDYLYLWSGIIQRMTTNRQEEE